MRIRVGGDLIESLLAITDNAMRWRFGRFPAINQIATMHVPR